MSLRLSSSRGNLSRVMNELKNDGYLEDTRAHVPIGKLRRKTYVLTEVGMREAMYLRAQVGERTVRLKDEDGKIVDVRLRDIPKDIRDGSTLLDIALNVYKGVFDKKTFLQNMRKRSHFLCIETQRPRLLYFFGREKQLRAVSDWFHSDTERILELKGIAGMGKSAFVAKAFNDLKQETNALWLGLNEQTSREGVMNEVAGFLKLLGRDKLDAFLKSRAEIQEEDSLEAVRGGRGLRSQGDGYGRLDEFLYVLGAEMEEVDALIVFDGCERVQDDLADFIGLTIGRMREHHGVKIIISGRDLSRIKGLNEWRKNKQLKTMTLRELDHESSIRILQQKGVETWRLEEAYEQTGGLPFFLELMGPSYESRATDIDNYLEEEILHQLSPEEERVLGIISVFSEPVHSDAFFQWKSMRFGTIRSLVDRSLLIEVSPMVYDTHDILKDFAGSRLSEKASRSYHRKAAAYYLEQGEVEDMLRCASHLVAAGSKVKAGLLLKDEGRRIISKGHSRELYQLLQKLDTGKRLKNVSELAFLRGECLSMRGLCDEAIEEYDHSLLLSEAEDDMAGISVALRRIAEIHLLRGNYGEVIEPLERSAELSKKIGDSVGMAECYYNIASTLWAKGDIKRSQEYVAQCLEIAESSGDFTVTARAYKALGILNDEMGNEKKGLSAKRKAVGYARKSENMALLSLCLNDLANSYYDLERDEDSLKLAEEALEAAKKLGSAREIAWSLSNLSSDYIVRREFEKAKEVADEAAEICLDLKENRLLAQIYIRYGYIFKEEDWGKAQDFLKKSLDLMDRFGSPADRCVFYTNVGHLYLWRSKEKGLAPDKQGLTYIKQAETLLRSVKEVPRRKELEAKIGDALRTE
jgi:tetratricopeptide (TPR) repeat protein